MNKNYIYETEITDRNPHDDQAAVLVLPVKGLEGSDFFPALFILGNPEAEEGRLSRANIILQGMIEKGRLPGTVHDDGRMGLALLSVHPGSEGQEPQNGKGNGYDLFHGRKDRCSPRRTQRFRTKLCGFEYNAPRKRRFRQPAGSTVAPRGIEPRFKV